MVGVDDKRKDRHDERRWRKSAERPRAIYLSISSLLVLRPKNVRSRFNHLMNVIKRDWRGCGRGGGRGCTVPGSQGGKIKNRVDDVQESNCYSYCCERSARVSPSVLITNRSRVWRPARIWQGQGRGLRGVIGSFMMIRTVLIQSLALSEQWPPLLPEPTRRERLIQARGQSDSVVRSNKRS